MWYGGGGGPAERWLKPGPSPVNPLTLLGDSLSLVGEKMNRYFIIHKKKHSFFTPSYNSSEIIKGNAKCSIYLLPN